MQQEPGLFLPVVSGGNDRRENTLVFDRAPFCLAFEVGAFLCEAGDVFLALEQLLGQALDKRVLVALHIVG